MKNRDKIWTHPLIIMSALLIATSSCKKDSSTTPNTVIDVDGNVYHTVTIGTQTWMVENLRTTKYNDNTAIPKTTDPTAWAALITPGVCTYNNTTNADTIYTYGCLYNWYSVNTGKLAPKGWHVPTDAEFITLGNYLIANGYNYDGSKTGDITSNNNIAKAMASAIGWTTSSVTGAVGNSDFPAKRNATGFTALPAGEHDGNGVFNSIGSGTAWWSATEYNVDNAWHRFTNYHTCNFGRNNINKSYGFSVRCVWNK
jgi:uncharacterized protein (TIGR02145 family)